jgi:putative DNA primase/helicase
MDEIVNIHQALEAANPLGLNAIHIGEFLKMDIPPREMVVSPIIPTQGLAMLFASRGVGKTHVALGLAYSVASGSPFLKWTTPKPRKVLYIDGEMPAVAMQDRISTIIDATDNEPPGEDYLRLITPDLQGDYGIPDLSTVEGQSQIDDLLFDTEFLILDNLSTLCRSGRENESESWQCMQEWALKLRRNGVSVLFVHHSGKGGQQRGTSRREDVLDTVVRLEHPSDYQAEEGARFEVHLDKARGIMGDDAISFEAKLGVGGEWTFLNVEDSRMKRAASLSNDGLTQRDIAKEMDVSAGTINKLIKKARVQGLIYR